MEKKCEGIENPLPAPRSGADRDLKKKKKVLSRIIQVESRRGGGRHVVLRVLQRNKKLDCYQGGEGTRSQEGRTQFSQEKTCRKRGLSLEFGLRGGGAKESNLRMNLRGLRRTKEGKANGPKRKYTGHLKNSGAEGRGPANHPLSKGELDLLRGGKWKPFFLKGELLSANAKG